jgi:hypothetical protein
MLAGMPNITDVPFPCRSGREKYQFPPLQQINPMIEILFDDFLEYLTGVKSLFHILAP